MTAAEARELSKERYKERYEDLELDAIMYAETMEVILKQIQKDETNNALYWGHLNNRLIHRLESDGYKVIYSSLGNDSWYEISWKDESI